MKTEPQEISLPNITLRDFFAGLAMAAMVGNYRRERWERDGEGGGSVVESDWYELKHSSNEQCGIAEVAYMMANEMLDVRQWKALEFREEDDHEETV